MAQSRLCGKYSSHEQIAAALNTACRANNSARVRELFKTKLLDAADATRELKNISLYVDENTPRRTSLMHCLLEHNADPNVIDIRWVESPDILKLLAEFGYDIKTQGHLRFCGFGETLDWLLDQGVDINQTDIRRDDAGRRPCGLRNSSLNVLDRVAARGDIQLFDHLVSRGADPSRSLALHLTAKCQDPEKTTAMISHLLDVHGLDINADSDVLRDYFDNPTDTGCPLNFAIYHFNLTAVQELLRRGACPNHKPNMPVCLAVGTYRFEGYLPALKPLLDAGADRDLALYQAAWRENFEAARISLEYGADPVYVLSTEKDRILECQALNEEFPDRHGDPVLLSDDMRKLLQDWKHVGENIQEIETLHS